MFQINSQVPAHALIFVSIHSQKHKFTETAALLHDVTDNPSRMHEQMMKAKSHEARLDDRQKRVSCGSGTGALYKILFYGQLKQNSYEARLGGHQNRLSIGYARIWN